MAEGMTSPSPIEGPCCACGQFQKMNALVVVDKRRPTPGHGWGCVVCGLPMDGAIAVVCDECVEQRAEIRWVCADYPLSPGRVEITALTEPFQHDRSRHLPEDFL